MEKISNKTFLIIEDDSEMITLLRKIIEAKGGKVFSASKVKDAISKAQSEAPHLIFLDLNLGHESGFDFLEMKLQTRSIKDIPVIVISAHKNKKYIVKANQYRVNSYLFKPITPHSFILKTRQILDQNNLLQVNLKKPAPVTIKTDAELKKMSEVEICFSSSIKFHSCPSIKIESAFLKDIGLTTSSVDILHEGQSNEDGQYDSYAAIRGMSEKALAKIRRMNT